MRHQPPQLELERAVATCLLWENTFYEKGSALAARIGALVRQVTFAEAATVAVRARYEWRLRHAPLFLVAEMAAKRAEHKGPITGIGVIGDTLANVIQRPDELAEFLAIYWRNGKRPLAEQVKRGLAMAFTKFDEYQLAKWNRDGAIKLRDVLFLCHAKPKDDAQAALWQRLIDRKLVAPDTWEVALSAGADKAATFTRLLAERKLGIMALLMNLRNMLGAGVPHGVISTALMAQAPGSKALPFRFLTATRHAPGMADALSNAMLAALAGEARLGGTTHVLVDVSGSMDQVLSAKGETRRIDAACGVAILAREVCEHVRVFSFSNALAEVPNHRGIPLHNAIVNSQPNQGTYLGAAVTALCKTWPGADRLIVITDEQSSDALPAAPVARSYLLNVAGYQPALDAHQGWQRISGFSERVFDWLRLHEQVGAA